MLALNMFFLFGPSLNNIHFESPRVRIAIQDSLYLHFGEHKLNHSTLNGLPCCSPAGRCGLFTRCACSCVRPSERIVNLYARAAPCANGNIYFQGQHVKLTCWALHFSDPLLLHRSSVRRRLRGSSCKNAPDVHVAWDFHEVSPKRPWRL